MAYTIFRIPVGYRLYDREKNKVVLLHEEEFRALERIEDGKGKDGDYAILHELQRKGYCRESPICEIEHPATHTVQVHLKTRVQQMILQVTQNCNLRCSYCAYSGKYYNRQHNGKRMTLDTAIKAVDFLMSHSSEVEEVALGFYGGEPLLEFELIKKVVEYVETQYPARKVQFVITSNLTLFTDDIIDYIIGKNIQLMISIDGPQKIQDKYRIFSNGKGSYNVVAKNARKIRDKSPEYFRRCVTNTVASPDEDYESIRTFLDTDELFGPLKSMFTQVNDSGLKEKIEYNDDFYQMVRREKFKVLLYMAGALSSEKISPTFIHSKVTILQTNQLLSSFGTQNTKKTHPSGPCIPGIKRVFVDTDGLFYPCERIAEYEHFQIGSLESGFDIERVKAMLNVGKYTEKECLNCWAFLFCGTCIANMIEGNAPTRTARLKKCPDTRQSTIDKLSDMEMVKYYGFSFAEESEEEE